MIAIFLIAAAWLAYVYLGYPAVLAVVGLWKRVQPKGSASYTPTVSVLIAARNEAKDIGWKIEETLNWNYPADKLEVLIGSDASDDLTDEVVRRYAERGVKLIRMERRGGKARALNQLATMARGEVFFFTDANAHIEPNSLRQLVSYFADPRVGCVTGDTRPIEEWDSRALALGAGVYWGYEALLRRLENNVGSVLVCDGAIFCLRAAMFEPLSPDLANDLESPMRTGAAGCWVLHEPRVLAFEHETSSALEEFTRRRRICAQGMLAVFRLRGALRGFRGFQFVSHKLLRWLSLIPVLLVLAASIGLARQFIFFRSLLLLQGIFYALAALGFGMAVRVGSVPRLFAVPFYIVLGLLGAMVGAVESLLGRRFDIWEIPVLSRGHTMVDDAIGAAQGE